MQSSNPPTPKFKVGDTLIYPPREVTYHFTGVPPKSGEGQLLRYCEWNKPKKSWVIHVSHGSGTFSMLESEMKLKNSADPSEQMDYEIY